jgi:hypothetical protein
MAAGLLAITLPRVAAQGNIDPSGNLVVIVSAQNKARALSYAVVRSIFMGVPTYTPAGAPYVPLTQAPQTPVRVAFDEQFLGLDPDAVGRYWVDQRIRARATPPRTIPSVDTLRRVVATLPEAISYVRADELRPGVVPVAIDGIDFRDPGYRFKMTQLATLTSRCSQAPCAVAHSRYRPLTGAPLAWF